MQTRDTSRQAFATISSELGVKQGIVYRLLKRSEPMTNREISKVLDWEINTVTPRVNELRKMGFIEEMGKRDCRISGMNAYVWGVPRETLFS